MKQPKGNQMRVTASIHDPEMPTGHVIRDTVAMRVGDVTMFFNTIEEARLWAVAALVALTDGLERS